MQSESRLSGCRALVKNGGVVGAVSRYFLLYSMYDTVMIENLHLPFTFRIRYHTVYGIRTVKGQYLGMIALVL